MRIKTQIVLGSVTFLAFGSLLGVVRAQHAAQPEAAPATILVLPKGTYTSIIFTATGVPESTAATGVIKVGTKQFLLNIAPGTTFAVPFGAGWELAQDAEIRLSRGAGSLGAVPTAWAVTPEGPVALQAR